MSFNPFRHKMIRASAVDAGNKDVLFAKNAAFEKEWELRKEYVHLAGRAFRVVRRPHWEVTTPTFCNIITILEGNIFYTMASGRSSTAEIVRTFEVFLSVLEEMELVGKQYFVLVDSREITYASFSSQKLFVDFYTTYPSQSQIHISGHFTKFAFLLTKPLNPPLMQAWKMVTSEEEGIAALFDVLANRDRGRTTTEKNIDSLLALQEKRLEQIYTQLIKISDDSLPEELPDDIPSNDPFVNVFHALNIVIRHKREQVEELKIVNQRLSESNEEILRQKSELQDQAAEIEIINGNLLLRNEELLTLNWQKNEFLGIASHDLKNPLNAITMLASILEKEAATLSAAEVSEFAADIRTSSRRMFELIKNLLDINKIEQGNILADIQTLSLRDSICSAIEHHKTAAQQKGIELLEDVADIEIHTSPSALLQVLDNLISNAIKFSDKGKQVSIDASVTADRCVRIRVQDQGPGLTPEDKSKLFGKFMRLSAQPTGGEHSTGLGLSIVKKLVELLGGKIWCESEPGNGAAFVIELPMNIA